MIYRKIHLKEKGKRRVEKMKKTTKHLDMKTFRGFLDVSNTSFQNFFLF
ncbi:hypothetical protein B4079_1815 [Bacillus cereus]|nr:hypothetical protein B4079_1815 [Bacillus cereus]